MNSKDSYIVSIASSTFISFLEEPVNKLKDEGLHLLYRFISTVRIYCHYYKAMRTGNQIMQEQIVTDWIGIFYALGKRNYVNICLNTIDKKYNYIDYKILE